MTGTGAQTCRSGANTSAAWAGRTGAAGLWGWGETKRKYSRFKGRVLSAAFAWQAAAPHRVDPGRCPTPLGGSRTTGWAGSAEDAQPLSGRLPRDTRVSRTGARSRCGWESVRSADPRIGIAGSGLAAYSATVSGSYLVRTNPVQAHFRAVWSCPQHQ